jgi:hypothetical protein
MEGLGLVVVLALAGMTPARAELNVNINLRNAPPPPVVVYRTEPHMVYVPESRVYVVDDNQSDYDYFHYGPSWYIYRSGYWYRARNYRGPFTVIEERYVPAPIWRVPERRWRHIPPGHFKRREVVVVKEKGRGRDYDRGHGHGNGKDKDHDHN